MKSLNLHHENFSPHNNAVAKSCFPWIYPDTFPLNYLFQFAEFPCWIPFSHSCESFANSFSEITPSNSLPINVIALLLGSGSSNQMHCCNSQTLLLKNLVNFEVLFTVLNPAPRFIPIKIWKGIRWWPVVLALHLLPLPWCLLLNIWIRRWQYSVPTIISCIHRTNAAPCSIIMVPIYIRGANILGYNLCNEVWLDSNFNSSSCLLVLSLIINSCLSDHLCLQHLIMLLLQLLNLIHLTG